MSYKTDFDYKSLLKPQTGEPFNLFRRRVDHWIKMLQHQNEAFSQEDAKLSIAGGKINWKIDLDHVEVIREKCLNEHKFFPEAFDPTGSKQLANIGGMSLEKPGGAQSKWSFYTGLLMSRNLALNPAFYVRLEPIEGEVASNVRLPALALMPDQMDFTTNWRLLEGTKQDIYAVAILSAYDFSTRPSCAEVAQGMIAVLLSGFSA